MNDSNLWFIRDLFCLLNLLSSLYPNGWVVMSNKKFNEAFLRAVDFAFDSLGKSCKQALYFHLENSFHVGRENVSEKVEDFGEALELIFKDGVIYLKKLVLKKLCEDLGVKFEESYVSDFAMAISKIKGVVSEGESLLMISGFNEESGLVKKGRRGVRVGSKS